MSEIGFKTYHSDITLNFMLNRLSRAIDPDELTEFANGFSNLDEFIDASLAAAEKAEADERLAEAGTYYRGAEFFMAPDHPRKSEAYEKFMDFFDRSNPEVPALRETMPYKGGELGLIDIPASGEERDVILACSGFDGLIEEMYANMCQLAAEGFRVVIYEGPGQGSALRRYHLTMPYDWERPVSAILDHLGIESCTLLGLSLGGYLAPRAAAFEQRAKRLIAWGPMFDFFQCFGGRMDRQAFEGLNALVEAGERDALNEILNARMGEDTTARWSITHGIHTCGAETPFDFFRWAKQMHLRDVSERITQDTLIIAASKDHLVPADQAWQQGAALKKAKSITVRMFTEHENASEHCQVTNPGIVVNEISRWLTDRLTA